MNIDEIRRIAEIMQKHELSEFSMESEDCRVKLRRGGGQEYMPMAPPPGFGQPYYQPPAQSHPGPAGEGGVNTGQQEKDTEKPVNTIDSPIVGTFYNAPAPDAEPFVKVGDTVTSDTVVCIIEAMKVMNEIKAEKSGRVKRVLVENTQPVEFGEPLFEIE